MKLLVTRGAPHEYTDPADGHHPYISNSQILTVLFGDRFVGVDEAMLELARMRGVDLHTAFFYSMASLRGLCPKPERPVEFMSYFDAIWRWIADLSPVPLLLEESSVDRKLGVAGTPDAKVRIGRKIIGIELKTAQPHRAHKVQVNIYRNFEEYQDCDTWHLLYLKKSREYDFPLVYRNPFHRAWIENGVQVLRGRMMDDE